MCEDFSTKSSEITLFNKTFHVDPPFGISCGNCDNKFREYLSNQENKVNIPENQNQLDNSNKPSKPCTSCESLEMEISLTNSKIESLSSKYNELRSNNSEILNNPYKEKLIKIKNNLIDFKDTADEIIALLSSDNGINSKEKT